MVGIDDQIALISRMIELRRAMAGAVRADKDLPATEAVLSTLKAVRDYGRARHSLKVELAIDPDGQSVAARTAHAELDIAWSKLWPAIKPLSAPATEEANAV